MAEVTENSALASISLCALGSFRSPDARFNTSAAEIAAYDPITKRLFVANTGDKRIEILDISNLPNVPSIPRMRAGNGLQTAVHAQERAKRLCCGRTAQRGRPQSDSLPSPSPRNRLRTTVRCCCWRRHAPARPVNLHRSPLVPPRTCSLSRRTAGASWWQTRESRTKSAPWWIPQRKRLDHRCGARSKAGEITRDR